MYTLIQRAQLAALIVPAASLLAGCGTAPIYPAEARVVYINQVAPYPQPLPTAAPQASKVRCETLPATSAPGKPATTQDLLLEVHRTRTRYVECANRHNVLIDFQGLQEKALVDMYNHYQKQQRP